jgi:putative membrane protein
MVILVYLLLSWLANIVSLLVADWLFDGVSIDGWWPLILGAAVLGIANTIIKPILTLLTLPLVIVTLGLFYFVINVFMLVLAEWIAPDFSIDGFWTYIGATIVVSIVNWAMHGIYGMFESSKSPQLAS